MPVKLVNSKPAVDPPPRLIKDVTRGRQSSSFRIVIPAKIVEVAGYSKEECFNVIYNTEKDLLILKRPSYEELEEEM